MQPEQYKPSTSNIGFEPFQAPDVAATYQQQFARQRAQEQRRLGEIAENDRVRIEEAKKQGELWSELGQFSQSALKVGQEFLERAAKDKRTGESYDAFYGAQDFTKEEQETTELERENETVAKVAEAVEAESGPVAGTTVKRELGDRAAGFRGELAAVMQARGQYSSWLASYLSSANKITIDGQTLTVREAVQSGDSRLTAAAIQQGRFEFIKEMGLYKASKDVMVKNLMQPMMAVESALGGSLTTKAIQGIRDENIRSLSGEAFQDSSDDLQKSWDGYANRFYTSDTGLTRSEANEAALDAMLAGMVSRRDVDSIRELKSVLKIRNADGSYNTKETLGANYFEKFEKAEEDALKAESSYIKKTADAIESDMYRELRQASSPEQKDAIIRRANARLIAIGEDEKARNLMLDRDALVISEAQDFNAADLEQQIDNGEDIGTDDIDNAEARGDITPEVAKNLRERLTSAVSVEKPKNKAAADIAGDYQKRFKNQFLPAVGLKTDITGTIMDVDGKTKIVSKSDAELILGQAERDINAVVNRVLFQNPKLADNPTELQRIVSENLDDWYKLNVMSDGGKFRLDDIENELVKYQDGIIPSESQVLKAGKARFSELIKDSARRSRIEYPRSSAGGRDLTSQITFGAPVDGATAKQFNRLRPDQVVSLAEIETESERIGESGMFSPGFIKLANDLGMTPSGLLAHQRAAYGLTGYSQPAPLKVTNMVEGAQYLMSQGFPARGAAYLSGNIQQESGWYGQRKPWDDVGAPAGGLVSWRAGRLDAIEGELGEIETVNNEDQLQYMIRELRKPEYKTAYRIFMNPFATQRQLIRASKIFWGYGDEGARFDYADQTLQQLN